MKKFTINCDFGGQMAPFTIYIGVPEQSHHPLHFQADWLSKNRGGTIPGEIMDAVSQLQELANKNGVPLDELCVYALGSDDQESEAPGEGEEIVDDNPEEYEEEPDELEPEEDEKGYVSEDDADTESDEESQDMVVETEE